MKKNIFTTNGTNKRMKIISLERELTEITAYAKSVALELEKETKLRMFFERTVHEKEKGTIALAHITFDQAVELIGFCTGFLKDENEMVILDPEINGCVIHNGMAASYIKGSPDEVCQNIVCRTCCGIKTNGKPKQILKIAIVTGGIGAAYIAVLEHIGLKVERIQSKSIDLVLPEIREG